MRQTVSWISIISQISVQVPIEFLWKLATLGLVLIATWIISIALRRFISKAIGKISKNVASQASRFATWLIWLIGILVGLHQLGLELTILLVILVLGGIIVAIALRDVMSNMASHEAITAYTPFKIGDWVQVGKCFGRVVDITWMDTILITPDNEMIYVPNSKMTKSIVINRTVPGGIRISVPLTVDKALDISLVEKSLLEIGTELSEELIPGSKPEVSITNINNSSIELALLLKINNPAKERLITSEVLKKAKRRLDEIQRKTSL